MDTPVRMFSRYAAIVLSFLGLFLIAAAPAAAQPGDLIDLPTTIDDLPNVPDTPDTPNLPGPGQPGAPVSDGGVFKPDPRVFPSGVDQDVYRKVEETLQNFDQKTFTPTLESETHDWHNGRLPLESNLDWMQDSRRAMYGSGPGGIPIPMPLGVLSPQFRDCFNPKVTKQLMPDGISFGCPFCLIRTSGNKLLDRVASACKVPTIGQVPSDQRGDYGGYWLEYWWPEYEVEINNFGVAAFNPIETCSEKRASGDKGVGADWCVRPKLEAQLRNFLVGGSITPGELVNTLLKEKFAGMGILPTQLPKFPQEMQPSLVPQGIPGLSGPARHIGQSHWAGIQPGDQITQGEAHVYRTMLSVAGSMSRTQSEQVGYRRRGKGKSIEKNGCCFYNTLPPAPSVHPIVNGWTERFPASAFWRTEELSKQLATGDYAGAYDAVRPPFYQNPAWFQSLKMPAPASAPIPLGCTAFRAAFDDYATANYSDLQTLFGITPVETEIMRRVCYLGGGDLFPVTGQLIGSFNTLPAAAYLSRRALYLFGKQSPAYSGRPVASSRERIIRFNDKYDKLQRVYPGVSQCFSMNEVPNLLKDGTGDFKVDPKELANNKGSVRYVYWNRRTACMCPHVGPANPLLALVPGFLGGGCHTLRPACYAQDLGDKEFGDQNGPGVNYLPPGIPQLQYEALPVPGIPYPFFENKTCELCNWAKGKLNPGVYSKCGSKPCGPASRGSDNDGNPDWYLAVMLAAKGAQIVGDVLTGGLTGVLQGFLQSAAHNFLVANVPGFSQLSPLLRATLVQGLSSVKDIALSVAQDMVAQYLGQVPFANLANIAGGLGSALQNLSGAQFETLMGQLKAVPGNLQGSFLEQYNKVKEEFGDADKFTDVFGRLKDEVKAGDILGTLNGLENLRDLYDNITELPDDVLNDLFKQIPLTDVNKIVGALPGMTPDSITRAINIGNRLSDSDRGSLWGSLTGLDDPLGFLDFVDALPTDAIGLGGLPALESIGKDDLNKIFDNMKDPKLIASVFQAVGPEKYRGLANVLKLEDPSVRDIAIATIKNSPYRNEYIDIVNNLPAPLVGPATQVINRFERLDPQGAKQIFDNMVNFGEQLKTDVVNLGSTLSDVDLKTFGNVIKGAGNVVVDGITATSKDLYSQASADAMRTYLRTLEGMDNLKDDFVADFRKINAPDAGRLLDTMGADALRLASQTMKPTSIESMVRTQSYPTFNTIVNGLGGTNAGGSYLQQVINVTGAQDLNRYIQTFPNANDFLRQVNTGGPGQTKMTPEQLANEIMRQRV